MAGDTTALCSWAKNVSITVPLSIHAYKWVAANLMLGVTSEMDSHPIQGGEYSWSLRASETEINSRLLATWLVFRLIFALFFLDFVDNRLLDLYGVELGELVETTSLLTPYMMAYCRTKKHLVQKFAQELIYYGYAGLQSHFTYRTLLDATKGTKSGIDDDDEANNALMAKLYKFSKMAEVFREASLSEPGRALQLKLEDEILAQISNDEAGITGWLSKKILNPNDWPYECVIKGADGQERNSLVIQYRKIDKIKDHWLGIASPEQLFTKEPWGIQTRTEYEIRSTYVRAPRGKRLGQCTKPGTDNVMIVSYYPDPCCGEEKTVFVSWKKVAVCFYENPPANQGRFRNCHSNEVKDCEFYGPKEMLDSADRF